MSDINMERLWSVLDEFEVFGKARQNAEKKMIDFVQSEKAKAYRKGLKEGEKK